MQLLYSLCESGTEYTVVGYSGEDATIVIPARYQSLRVTAIAAMAFSHGENPAVTTVTFEEPSNVLRIGSYAFYKCENFTITLPESIAIIEEGAFAGVGGVLYKGRGIYFKGEPHAGSGEIGSVHGYYPHVHAEMWEDALVEGAYRGLPMSVQAMSTSTSNPKTKTKPKPKTKPTQTTSLLAYFLSRSGGKRAKPRVRKAIHVLPRIW